MANPRVALSTEDGAERIVLENDHLRVEVLPEKGADVLKLLDRDLGENLLFEAPHNWQLPGSYTPPAPATGLWLDCYPGGWQDCLPFGGDATEVMGAKYGMHGESALLPWDWDIADTASDRAEVRFRCDLVRYPFRVERTLALQAEERVLRTNAAVENRGTVTVPFNWLQHICYGPPLIGPEATLRLPDGTVTVAADPQGESPLDWGESFTAPVAPDGTDLRTVPELNSGIHDLCYIHDLSRGEYGVRNPTNDIGISVSFDDSIFESLWIWRSFEGIDESPFFGRERVIGIEPATGWPSTDLPESQGPEGTGTLKHLDPEHRIETSIQMTVTDGDGRPR